MKHFDDATKATLEKVAFDEKEERSASFLAADWDILDVHSATEGLEILPIETALKKYEWLKELFFTLVEKDKDSYVKQVASSDVLHPYQGWSKNNTACLYMLYDQQ